MTKKVWATLLLSNPMVSRCFWALMGIMHAAALFASWKVVLEGGQGASGATGCVTLTFAMLFFLLKVGGVSFLQLRPSRRTWVVACLLVAWIHVDCIDPNLTAHLSDDGTDLVATTFLFGGLTQISKATRSVIERGTATQRVRGTNRRSGETVWLDDSRPCCWVLASHLFRLRAPPA
ncbi:MAG: hypothetical protein JSU63_14740 [Phycisphaerales bacterium]|nr:MAG: hypothetical protein JSU63_14740 [Phycisphaerales bacterium]